MTMSEDSKTLRGLDKFMRSILRLSDDLDRELDPDKPEHSSSSEGLSYEQTSLWISEISDSILSISRKMSACYLDRPKRRLLRHFLNIILRMEMNYRRSDQYGLAKLFEGRNSENFSGELYEV